MGLAGHRIRPCYLGDWKRGGLNAGGRGGLHFKATAPDALPEKKKTKKKTSLKVVALTQNCLVTNYLIVSNKVKLFAGETEIMVRTCYSVAKPS